MKVVELDCWLVRDADGHLTTMSGRVVELFYYLTKIKTAPYAMMKTCKHCFESKVSQIMFVSFSATICHYKVYMYNVHTLVLLSLFFSHHWFEELKGLIDICRHQEKQTGFYSLRASTLKCLNAALKLTVRQKNTIAAMEAIWIGARTLHNFFEWNFGEGSSSHKCPTFFA